MEEERGGKRIRPGWEEEQSRGGSRQAINYYNIIIRKKCCSVTLNVDTSLFSLPLSYLSAYLALERAGKKKSGARDEGVQECGQRGEKGE